MQGAANRSGVGLLRLQLHREWIGQIEAQSIPILTGVHPNSRRSAKTLLHNLLRAHHERLGRDSQAASNTATPTVDKNMFLQLLVAQLRNQDPLHPSDGTQFVAQLAQFQQLETSLNTGQDIAAMRQDLDAMLTALAATGS